jgi:hypothetical protein
MGDPHGVLGTLPGGGAAVYLPDFAMALVAPPGTGVDDVAPLLQVALPSIVPPGKPGKKQSMLDRLLASFSGSTDLSISGASSQKEQLRCVFKQESDTFHLVDYASLKSLTVRIPGAGIRSVRRVGDSNSHWMVSANKGNGPALQHYMVTVSPSAETAMCYPVDVGEPHGGNSTTDATPAWDDHHYDSWKTEGYPSSFKASTVGWGASNTAHYGEMELGAFNAIASGALKVWPRSESVGANSTSPSFAQAASSLLSRSGGAGGPKDVVIPSINSVTDMSVNSTIRASRGKKSKPLDLHDDI